MDLTLFCYLFRTCGSRTESQCVGDWGITGGISLSKAFRRHLTEKSHCSGEQNRCLSLRLEEVKKIKTKTHSCVGTLGNGDWREKGTQSLAHTARSKTASARKCFTLMYTFGYFENKALTSTATCLLATNTFYPTNSRYNDD